MQQNMSKSINSTRLSVNKIYLITATIVIASLMFYSSFNTNFEKELVLSSNKSSASEHRLTPNQLNSSTQDQPKYKFPKMEQEFQAWRKLISSIEVTGDISLDYFLLAFAHSSLNWKSISSSSIKLLADYDHYLCVNIRVFTFGMKFFVASLKPFLISFES